MALIDVSSLLTDIDFVNRFTVVRRDSVVNAYGENELHERTIEAIGSVQAGNGDTLLRLPESARHLDNKTIYTKTELRSDSCGGYSDIIIIKNKRYQVLVITPWGNFGGGWYQCDCVAEAASV